MEAERVKTTAVVSAVVPVDVREWLRRRAYDRDMTLSLLLREIIEREQAKEQRGQEAKA